MKPYKMIVTDLDNTFLHNDKSISAYSKKILKECRDKGIVTVMATARYFLAAREYIDEFDYLISADGATIYQGQKFLFGKAIDSKIINELIEISTKELVFVTKQTCFHNIKELGENDPLIKGKYTEKFDGFDEAVYKVVTKKENINNSVTSKIEQYGCKLIEYRDGDWAAIVSSDINKLNAIKELSGLLKIDISQIVAFGDDDNDIEMISECGLGVAVENAIETVKRAANEITASNEMDGAAKFIEKKILTSCFKAIIFDFDYTLGDSTKGIELSINYALEQMGHSAKNISEIKKTIGLSLTDTYFTLTTSTNTEEAKQFAKLFKEKADKVMVDNTELYNDVKDILQKLKSDGYIIGIVTTKFHYRIEQILRKFDASELVDIIVGAEDVKIEKPAPEGLLWIISHLGLTNADILYVGDSIVDAKTAQNANVSFVGVLTGTTTKEAFEKYNNIYIGENISDIYNFINV